MVRHGEIEGEICLRGECEGVIQLAEVEGCSCHIAPPCGACTTDRHHCPLCDWRAIDE